MSQLDDDLFGRGAGDPDHFGNPAERVYRADNIPGEWIGVDKPVVQHHAIQYEEKQSWYDRDNDARSPLEADLGDIDE